MTISLSCLKIIQLDSWQFGVSMMIQRADQQPSNFMRSSERYSNLLLVRKRWDTFSLSSSRLDTCVCTFVHTVQWFVLVWIELFPIETLRVRSMPSTVTYVFLLLSLGEGLWGGSVVTDSQILVRMSECVVWKERRRELSWQQPL